MAFTSIEIMALVVIALAVVKMLVLLISPKSWMNFAKNILGKKDLTQVVFLILAGIVLYYLIQGGMTIVQILGAMAFMSLLMIVGLAKDLDYFIKKYQTLIKKQQLWKRYWLYALVWVILLAWGVKEIFF